MLAPAVALLAAYIVLDQFPRGLIVFACAAIALAAGWYGLLRRGWVRWAGLGVAAVALVIPVVLLVSDGDHVVEAILVAAGLSLCLAAARTAFRVHVPLASAP